MAEPEGPGRLRPSSADCGLPDGDRLARFLYGLFPCPTELSRGIIESTRFVKFFCIYRRGMTRAQSMPLANRCDGDALYCLLLGQGFWGRQISRRSRSIGTKGDADTQFLGG